MTERRKSSLAQTPSPCFSWHLFNLVTLEFNMWVCLTISVVLSFIIIFFSAVWSQFIVAVEKLRLSIYISVYFQNKLSKLFQYIIKPGFHKIATIAAIDEKNVQRSQRWYGNHSPAMAAITASVATTIAEIDFSSISAIVAIVAIIWKPLSSDHSDLSDSKLKVPGCIAYAHAFPDGCQHKHWESNRQGTFYGRSTKIRLSLHQIFKGI